MAAERHGQWRGLFRQLRRVGLAESFMQQLLEQKILLDSLKIHRLIKSDSQPMTTRGENPQGVIATQESLKGALLLQKLKQILFPLPMVQEVFLQTKSQREKVLFQLFRTQDKDIVEEVFRQLQEDHIDFGYLVKRFSKGPEKDRMGLVGPLPLNVLRPNIRQTLMALAPGEISEPLESEPGTWVVLRLLQYEAVTLTDTLQSQIREELLQQWLKHQTEQVKANIHKKRNASETQSNAAIASSVPEIPALKDAVHAAV